MPRRRNAARWPSRYLGVAAANQFSFRARIYVDGCSKTIGSFNSEEAAAQAYDIHASLIGKPINFPSALVAPVGLRVARRDDSNDLVFGRVISRLSTSSADPEAFESGGRYLVQFDGESTAEVFALEDVQVGSLGQAVQRERGTERAKDEDGGGKSKGIRREHPVNLFRRVAF